MKKKILIVEDEIIIANELSVNLVHYGYEVLTPVSSGLMALNVIEKERPDILLMDIYIEGPSDGIKTAMIIKEQYDIPVIFITGYSDNKTVEQAKKAEPYGYIVKPINIEDLKITIEIALYKYEADKKIKEIELEKNIKEKMLLRSQRLAALGELSISIAHEIRQPLQVIKVTADSMIYWYNKRRTLPAIEKQLSDMNEISNSAKRINDIIQKLQRKFKQYESAGSSTININEFIASIVEFYSNTLKKNEIELELALDKSVKEIHFSELNFEQIISNLISNAINAFNMTNRENKKIIIKTIQENDESVIIECIDNAIGIHEDIKEKIFNPLFTTNLQNDSMGLGLYIINSILAANNNVIYVENNSLGGATFKIVIN